MKRRLLNEKCGIITGCSSGIGRALALALNRRGMDLIVTARRAAQLEELRQACQAQSDASIELVVGDITELAVQTELCESARSRFGRLDCLINNAGVGLFGRFDSLPKPSIERMFAVDLLSVMHLTQAALPLLRGGDEPMIVNMGSVLGHFPVPLKSVYCAAKAAIRSWSDALRMELKSEGIDLLLVSPSTTSSNFFDALLADETGKNWLRFGAMTPQLVAEKTVQAMMRRRREIVLSPGGRLLVTMHRLMPRITRALLARDAGR